ncbi:MULTISPECIES: hypothetical protein [Enterobacteriaceae]|jgi:hypothetical protein|uniref:DUF7446 family protein n=1 Tax=Enterobacteriaceae TaxID=543 RepID=UPI0005EDA032|nr:MULTISPECIES: hypothetical protein [Enterobacteriaceae]EAB5938964.1 hypothetical protein [Salmonella enterica subsp. enterica serovar Minnesota]EBA9638318.1 hypothetical protein [Salmonella enterica subsp. enterica serovar Johannesburg]EBF9824614.1 hypothetical protein [Salmonella enterica subsp. enterica serovar Heidelberg]EKY0738193.1 hypothetical protein [Citrobacter koseri]MBE3303427.1 hypothetical protein [Enterobacter cloacae complex sp. P30U]HDC4403194.1 hypothetical protein [Entero
MSTVKMIGASPLTGTIFEGRLNPVKSCWVGKKTDVTDMVLRATADHLYVVKKEYAFPLRDGKVAVLSMQIFDEMPERFIGGTEHGE